MKKELVFCFAVVAMLMVSCASTKKTVEVKEEEKQERVSDEDIPALYTKFSFPLGAAINPNNFYASDSHNKLLRHFNAFVFENSMKQDASEPSPNQFNLNPEKKLIQYAEQRTDGVKLRGHTLVWHNQVPGWMFTGSGKNGMATKEELYERMERHIKTVVGEGKGKFYCWDVVNECISDNGSGICKDKYFDIVGSDEYIAKAFQFAHEADPDALLVINDYGLESKGPKQDAMFKEIKKLLAEGVPIGAVGLQGHISMYSPKVDALKATIERFASLGIKVQITELDISVYRSDSDATVKATDALLTSQAYRFKDLFTMFEDEYKKGNLDMVVLWGLSDDATWLNNFPRQGRTNYPLFFGKSREPKPAYWIFVDPTKVGKRPADSVQNKPIIPFVHAHEGTPAADKYIDDAAWNDVEPVEMKIETQGTTLTGSSYKVMWDDKYVYVRVDVKDSDLNASNKNAYEQDSVEVFIDQKNNKGSSYDGDDAQYRVSYLNMATFNGGNSSLFKSSAKKTDDGYVVFMACPLDKIKPEMGGKIGFDVQINQADVNGARTGIRNWFNNTNEGYTDPSGLGTLMFDR